GAVIASQVALPSPAWGGPSDIPDEVWAPLSTSSLSGRSPLTTYGPRFTAYLARFLINYDATSRNWWDTQQNIVTPSQVQKFSEKVLATGADAAFKGLDIDTDGVLSKEEFLLGLNDQLETFGRFQASTEVGLGRYQGKDGVKKIFSLLVREFGDTIAAKRQIVLLFSLMESDQPVDLIKKLMGETDNASIESFEVIDGGSGYDLTAKPPLASVESPLFGNDTAKAKVTLEASGKIFKINKLKGGMGYSTAPQVTVSSPRAFGGKAATAIALVRGGSVAGVVLTDPGQGYTEDDRVTVQIDPPPGVLVDVNPYESRWATAEAILDGQIATVEVEHPGSGYSCDVLPTITVEPPPAKVEYANFGLPAQVQAKVSPPPEGEILRSWLPPSYLETEVTELLPDNLVPKLDPCLGRFYVSPVEVLDPNYCIYFEASEFRVLPSEKLIPYFSFLDGPRARSPIEKERVLSAATFARFAACGAGSSALAHAFLVPIDVVKTRMQSDPAKYATMLGSFTKLVEEEGKDAFLVGAGATIAGYTVYGGLSFGLTEYFKRRFVELVGPQLSALYPVPLLLCASAGAATFAATAVTPFESIRIKAVTNPSFPKSLVGGLQETVRRGQLVELFDAVPVLLLAEIPFMMAKFATFDATSKLLYSVLPQASESVPLSLGISLLSGMIAGVVASLVSQPSDTIMTEVNDGEGNGAEDLIGTVKAKWEAQGAQGFYKGSVPRAIKSAANIAIQFFVYDAAKKLLHVAPADIKLFYDVLSGVELK
ncbi:unnamed protein product, partial [Chrysoparadoxa australica]